MVGEEFPRAHNCDVVGVARDVDGIFKILFKIIIKPLQFCTSTAHQNFVIDNIRDNFWRESVNGGVNRAQDFAIKRLYGALKFH